MTYTWDLQLLLGSVILGTGESNRLCASPYSRLGLVYTATVLHNLHM